MHAKFAKTAKVKVSQLTYYRYTNSLLLFFHSQ